MQKPSDKPAASSDQQAPQTSRAVAPTPKAWPFAPGSQLDKQVARPWTPKPSYRFNQR